MAEYKKTKRSADWNYGGAKWKLSRSKIDLFMECPRCFYLDNKLGVARPRGPAFTLNIAVDKLLKKEFDIHRNAGTAHPLMKKYGIEAMPLSHPEMGKWRENFVGIQYLHKPTNLKVSGAIDDVWEDTDGSLIIVDYKATSKEGDVTELSDTKWQNQYKRQMEIYQWLFRQNGFKVSETGYFLYVNGKTDKKAFDGKLEFDVNLIAYKGDDSWVSGVLQKIKECLDTGKIPPANELCEYCVYRENAGRAFREVVEAKVLGRDGKRKIVHKHNDEKDFHKKKTESHRTESLFLKKQFLLLSAGFQKAKRSLTARWRAAPVIRARRAPLAPFCVPILT